VIASVKFRVEIATALRRTDPELCLIMPDDLS
jgi:hypothetical protein